MKRARKAVRVRLPGMPLDRRRISGIREEAAKRSERAVFAEVVVAAAGGEGPLVGDVPGRLAKQADSLELYFRSRPERRINRRKKHGFAGKPRAQASNAS